MTDKSMLNLTGGQREAVVRAFRNAARHLEVAAERFDAGENDARAALAYLEARFDLGSIEGILSTAAGEALGIKADGADEPEEHPRFGPLFN